MPGPLGKMPSLPPNARLLAEKSRPREPVPMLSGRFAPAQTDRFYDVDGDGKVDVVDSRTALTHQVTVLDRARGTRDTFTATNFSQMGLEESVRVHERETFGQNWNVRTEGVRADGTVATWGMRLVDVGNGEVRWRTEESDGRSSESPALLSAKVLREGKVPDTWSPPGLGLE